MVNNKQQNYVNALTNSILRGNPLKIMSGRKQNHTLKCLSMVDENRYQWVLNKLTIKLLNLTFSGSKQNLLISNKKTPKVYRTCIRGSIFEFYLRRFTNGYALVPDKEFDTVHYHYNTNITIIRNNKKFELQFHDPVAEDTRVIHCHMDDNYPSDHSRLFSNLVFVRKHLINKNRDYIENQFKPFTGFRFILE